MSASDKLLVEGLRRMILSHGAHDDSAFVKGAESVIQEFVVTNHSREARQLRQALENSKLNGTGARGGAPLPLPQLSRSGEALIRLRTYHVERERLFLEEDARAALDRVTAEYLATTKLREHGLEAARRLLFWGPPGCGKTLAAQHLASELGLPLGIVRLGGLISSYLGETAANLQRVFGQAEQIPMVLLLDEVDAIAASRTSPNDVGELRRIVNGLLQCLDEVPATRSIVVLATNHQHLFDVAVWRRFDEVIEFTAPATPARRIFLRMLTSGLSTTGTMEAAVKATGGMSYADIERAVRSIQKRLLLAGESKVASSEIAGEAKEWIKKVSKAVGNSRGRRA